MRIHWTARKMNKWVLDPIKPETSLKENRMKLRLFCLGHMVRKQDSLGKTITLGKVEGNRKRGIPIMIWTDSLKEPTGLSLQVQGS